MIGQSKLWERLESLAQPPRTSIIVGARGFGKRTLVAEWVDHLKYDEYKVEDAKVDTIREIIEHAQSLSHPTMYIITDAHKMNVQAQNALLKMAEEPPMNAYIVLTTSDLSAVLPTIRSRSQVFYMNQYSFEELQQYTKDQLLLEACNSIGEIKMLEQLDDVNELDDHARKVVENIDRISVQNTFNILRHIEEKDYDAFLLLLLRNYRTKMRDHFMRPGDEFQNLMRQIRVVYKWKRTMENTNASKPKAFEMMLIEIREESRT